jgi:putative Mn2+ efflux pump MntP
MDLLTVIGIAVALSMDCFAVSVAAGVVMRNLEVRYALRLALSFGGFQAVMPVIGWFAGKGVEEYVAPWDHWAALSVLSFIGAKMIWESFRMEPGSQPPRPMSVAAILLLSIATSIDALAVGFSFAFLRVSIVMPVIVIGVVAFVTTLAGTAVGGRLGHFFERKFEIVGGVVLIAIGVRILFEHIL